jgi:hypothetical protein
VRCDKHTVGRPPVPGGKDTLDGRFCTAQAVRRLPRR